MTWMRQNRKEKILHVITNHYKNKDMVEFYDFLADRPGQYTWQAVEHIGLAGLVDEKVHNSNENLFIPISKND